MPLKKRLIRRHILNADNMRLVHFDDAVDKQKRVPMRQNLPDLIYIQNSHYRERALDKKSSVYSRSLQDWQRQIILSHK